MIGDIIVWDDTGLSSDDFPQSISLKPTAWAYGGEEGNANAGLKDLAARTRYLKAQVEDLFEAIAAGVNAATLEGYDLNQIKTQIVDQITNGAASAYDTLIELQQAIEANDGDISSLLSTLSQKANTSELLNYVPQPGVQNTDNWNGVAYVDPDAIGANPTAKIYPDGTIIGSTDNGEYIKYPNGEMTCVGMSADQYTTSNSQTGIFRTETITMDFPVEFVKIRETVPFTRNSLTATWGAINGAESLTSISIRIFGVISTSTANAAYRVSGTWK